jgi:hypothetical protein
MCLTKITATHDDPSDLIVDGWKEFSGTAAQPAFFHYTLGGKRDVPLDQWLTAEHRGAGIKASDGKAYQPGFHVYADERRALNLRRVYLRRVTCTGDQDGKKCMVAQEMYVPSSPNAWPPRSAPAKPTKNRIRKK